LEIESTLEQDIRKGQMTDEKIAEYKKLITLGKVPDFREDEQGTVWFKNRIYVPEIKELRETILKEAHDLSYSIHPGIDVSGLETEILVVWNEEGCSSSCSFV
jgi:hypothetical protein